MKTHTRSLLALLTALLGLIAAGCAHTASGVQQDYQSAEDHVERATK